MWGFVWKFQDFKEIGRLTFFVSFVFFVTGKGNKFGVWRFCQELSLFNNMLIDLDGRYLYGLIGELIFCDFIFLFFMDFILNAYFVWIRIRRKFGRKDFWRGFDIIGEWKFVTEIISIWVMILECSFMSEGSSGFAF